MTDAMILAVDGDIHGHYTDNVCFERYQGQLYSDTEKDPILTYEDLEQQLEYCQAYIKSKINNLLYRLEWINGDLWAIHPDAQWIDELETYHLLPDDAIVYTIEHNLFYAIVYNDYSGLSDAEILMIENWCQNNDIQDLVSLGDIQLAECDINGLLCENLVVCYAEYNSDTQEVA